MEKVTETHLVPGLFVSPGFYFNFWTTYLFNKYDENYLTKSNKYKPYREVLIGSILAAQQSKITGVQHFTGIPSDEPPDVEIVHIEQSRTRKGTISNNLHVIGVEIIRCDGDNNEDLLTHILAKNLIGNKGLTILVEAYGKDSLNRLSEVHRKIKDLELYPSDIYIISHLTKKGNILRLPDTFLVASLYPLFSVTEIHVDDKYAFFTSPAFITKYKRAISTEKFDLGTYRLLPPE